MTRNILIQLPSCPYCKNARKHLDKEGIKYDTIDIAPNDRSLVQNLSGQPSVPIFIQVVGEKNQDDDIIQWIAQHKKES